eukprot:gene10611-11553_t
MIPLRIITLTALLLLQLPLLYTWTVFRQRRHLSGSGSTVLKSGLEDDILAPAVFREDLYQVLNVPMNSTRKQLKEAYWKIAFNSHPDRNKTLDALYLYRNASHAYKILGKDPKRRAEYDAKYKTKRYIGLLEQVGTEVLQPLTTGVAIPLVNLTVQTISSTAVPLIQDLFEQSASALKENLTHVTETQTVTQQQIFQLQQTQNDQISYYDNIQSLSVIKEQQLFNASEEVLQLEMTSAQLDRSIAQRDVQIQSLEAQLKLLRAEREGLAVSQRMIQATLAMTSASGEKLQREISEFKRILSNASDVYQTYQTQRHRLEQQVESFSGQRALLQQRSEVLEEEKKAVTRRCSELQTRLTSLEEELEKERRRLEEFQASNPMKGRKSLPMDSEARVNNNNNNNKNKNMQQEQSSS